MSRVQLPSSRFRILDRLLPSMNVFPAKEQALAITLLHYLANAQEMKSVSSPSSFTHQSHSQEPMAHVLQTSSGIEACFEFN